MSIIFNYTKINRETLVSEEQHEFTNEAVLRALLRLEVRHYIEDNDERQEYFNAFLNWTYLDQHQRAIAELAPGESVVVPKGFYTETHAYILNICLIGESDLDTNSALTFFNPLKSNIELRNTSDDIFTP